MIEQFSASKKKQEENPELCDDMDEVGGYYVKWNKPDTEGQMLHDFTYTWNLKKLNW